MPGAAERGLISESFAYKWWPPGVTHKEGAKARFEFVKVVKMDRANGKKQEWREPKGGKNILFGMLAVPDSSSDLVIAEGELDAITWNRLAYQRKLWPPASRIRKCSGRRRSKAFWILRMKSGRSSTQKVRTKSDYYCLRAIGRAAGSLSAFAMET